eukprot:scaffold122120_cov35-Prasinocladus_malaysianus.AAC.1
MPRFNADCSMAGRSLNGSRWLKSIVMMSTSDVVHAWRAKERQKSISLGLEMDAFLLSIHLALKEAESQQCQRRLRFRCRLRELAPAAQYDMACHIRGPVNVGIAPVRFAQPSCSPAAYCYAVKAERISGKYYFPLAVGTQTEIVKHRDPNSVTVVTSRHVHAIGLEIG